MDGSDERFEILGTLGKGGMGTVFRARDRETGDIVAIKELHAMFVDDPDYVARFEREVEVARRIHSPNVVNVLGYGKRNGAPYMVMEYVEGESLRDVLKARTQLPWEEAKEIIGQVAEALRAAHRVGVIHRDVKPSNILIMPDGMVKLADFGIARATDLTRLTGGATMLGTPAYMAPENTPSPQSDLYGLGCVLYEMLSGQPPFNGDSQQEILIKHLRERPNLDLVPLPARRIVSALLQKTPQRRPQSATALLMLLESDTGPTTPPEPKRELTSAGGGGKGGAARGAGEGAPNHRTPAMVLGGIGAGVVLIAAIVLGRMWGDDDPARADDDPTPTVTSTATPGGGGGGTPPPTRPPGSVTPPPPTATPATGPRITESNWNPAAARFGDTITITLTYDVGDAPLTEIQLHETGKTVSGGVINWGAIRNIRGELVTWTSDNYFVTVWDQAANTKGNIFTMTLTCVGPEAFTSRMFIQFIDTKGRRTQGELAVAPICG